MAVLGRTVRGGLRRKIGWFFWVFIEVFERRNDAFWESPVAARDAIAGALDSLSPILAEAARSLEP